MSENKAEDDLRTQLRFIKDMGGSRAQIDAAIAKNILREDLGYYDSRQTLYNLDEDTRDRLIAHARQDGAHAVISIASVQRELTAIKRLVVILSIINIGLATYALFR